MSEFIFNKVFLMIFLMCILNCLNHTFNMIRRLREEIPSRYILDTTDKFLLGISISYIITTIFTGIIL